MLRRRTSTALARPAELMATMRLTFGVIIWVAPRTTMRVFGLNPRESALVPYLGRLVGARDAVIGAGLLRSADNDRRLWLLSGLACDVIDLAAVVIAAREGAVSRWSFPLVAGASVLPVGLAVLAFVAPPPAAAETPDTPGDGLSWSVSS